MKKVLLLNMPFVSLSRPAIGISVLKAHLAEEGIECDVAYPNLLFAEWVGVDCYQFIDERISLQMFVGDWLFAQHLFGERLDLDSYIQTLRLFLKNETEFQKLLEIRSIIGPFLNQCLEKLKVEEYGLVGFTTTFQQNLASLALAYQIKKTYPGKILVFGGGNCEGIMGFQLLSSFPWIDYVCCGEAESSFPALVKAIESGESVSTIGGIVYRDHDRPISTGPPRPIREMDQLPIPDYDDYFEALRNSPVSSLLSPVLPIENSRGCWWGAKSHCTFCGLNGTTMEFRSKSASRVLREVQFLKDRYQRGDFVAVDNIMDMRYFKDLLPRLKQEACGLSLFYETKANLKREQVKLLSEAGVKAIQPGIESLNTHVLKLMRKGTTALQNIELLKWCREYGVVAAWNLLCGFPGETPEDYEQTEEFIDALYHLPPPGVAGNIRLDRFSPYFNHPRKYGLTGIKPFLVYELIYPLPRKELFNLAYFFEYAYIDQPPPQSYFEKALRKVETWKSSAGGTLTKRYGVDPELLITDTRPNRRHFQVALSGIQREIYDYCDTGKSFQGLMDFAESRYDVAPDFQSWLQQFLGQMVDWRFMVRENDHYLSLAIGERV
jgi:ribosomal peptide maturation radical SAM protein 1